MLTRCCATFAAGIYEGFDMAAEKSAPLGTPTARAGQTSTGWHSSWHIAAGKPLYSAKDLKIAGLNSAGGSLVLRGERKGKSIGKGVAIRQIDADYTGDVYGSYRFQASKLANNSVLGLLISLPSKEVTTPMNATFSLCPKAWGSSYGMIRAGKARAEKIDTGMECYPMETYLVVWKLGNLPVVDQRKKVSIDMWVLDQKQAEHLVEKGFSEAALKSAKVGGEPGEVSQSAHHEIRDSTRGMPRGMVLSCFSTGMPKVLIDEIRVSADSLEDAVGLKKK